MKKMRMVGLNKVMVIVQTNEGKEWHQEHMSKDDFAQMMRDEFPEYAKEYDPETGKCMADFFYHYGETEEMQRKGDAYIYTA